MKRSATSKWSGDLKTGKGKISTESCALAHLPYGFNTRFENEPGTNPEELIAAAHSSCFAMALANELSQLGMTADSIDVKAVVSLEEKEGGGFKITQSALTVAVTTPGSDDKFEDALKNAKQNCPVSNALDMDVTVDVTRNDA